MLIYNDITNDSGTIASRRQRRNPGHSNGFTGNAKEVQKAYRRRAAPSAAPDVNAQVIKTPANTVGGPS